MTSSSFTALEYLDAEVGINSTWEIIRGNIKISARDGTDYNEFKKYKPS
jgi:hypothetical protein